MPHGLDDALRCKGVSEQGVVGMMVVKPCHDFVGLRMQDEFTAFEPDGRLARDATAVHDTLDVIERQVFTLLLPDVAVLAM